MTDKLQLIPRRAAGLAGSKTQGRLDISLAATTKGGPDLGLVNEFVTLDQRKARRRDVEQYEAQGYRVKVLRDTNLLTVGDYVINTEIALPALPVEVRLEAADVAPWTHHLVQLQAPPEPEDIQKIEAEGVEVVEPLGPYGLFVVGSSETVSQLPHKLGCVAWTGPFQPAYRIAGALRSMTGRISNVAIGVYPAEEGPAVAGLVLDTGGDILGQSPPTEHGGRYWRIVAVVDAAAVTTISRHPSVRWLEYAPPAPVLEGEREAQIAAGNLRGPVPPELSPGYLAWLGALGLDGTGVNIAICDTGVDSNASNNTATAHPDVMGRQLAFIDYSNGAEPNDSHGHGTHVAGIALGNAGTGQNEGGATPFAWGLGVAPGSRYITQNALRSKNWPPQDWAILTAAAVKAGAHVMNNSWADMAPGVGYTATSRRFDQLIRDPVPGSVDPQYLVIVFSAGNSGPEPGTITGPKECKNAIVVGNSLTWRPGWGSPDDVRGISTDSSRGPARDGRLAPVVVAPGTDVSSARSNWSTRPKIAATGNPAGQNAYTYMSGTSMAAPHVSGACALIIQWWQARTGTRPSPALLKALLVNSAEDCSGGPDGRGGVLKPIPNNIQGWGRVSLANLFRAPDLPQRTVVDGGPPFTANGQERVHRITALPDNRPLRVTLAWTDAPAAANANPALVNDLDLEVIHLTTGRVYKGNHFTGGFSAEGGDYDSLNNVECVFLRRAATGDEYEVRVIASHLRADARPPYGTAQPWQDFALVIDNA